MEMERSGDTLHTYRELRQKHEVLRNEYQAVKRKLDSKNDALLILSRELAGCQGERDQFKLMADQLRNRCQSLKKQLQSENDCTTLGYPVPLSSLSSATSQLEINDLKQRLADAEGDIKLLREKIIKHRLGTSEQQQSQRKSLSAHERDELIEELEKSRIEYAQLEQDMKQLLDLKEELVTERDAYKTKYNRLNTELNFIMRGDEKHVVDIDALIMENRFLQQRVKQLEEEKSAALTSLKKYKHIIEKRKPTGILKSTTNHMLGGLLISQRQVKQLLASPENSTSHASPQICQELKTLASTLLETINDKNLALNHQRKGNKLLASRITDLENKLHELELSGESNNFRGKFEGWCELRGDCADLKSLIPRLDSTETENSSDPDDSVNMGQTTPECASSEDLPSLDSVTFPHTAESLHGSTPHVELTEQDSLSLQQDEPLVDKKLSSTVDGAEADLDAEADLCVDACLGSEAELNADKNVCDVEGNSPIQESENTSTAIHTNAHSAEDDEVPEQIGDRVCEDGKTPDDISSRDSLTK